MENFPPFCGAICKFQGVCLAARIIPLKMLLVCCGLLSDWRTFGSVFQLPNGKKKKENPSNCIRVHNNERKLMRLKLP